MMRRTGLTILGLALAGLMVATGAPQAAQQELGSVDIPRRVMANGQALAAGSYTVRLLDEPVEPAVGQSAGAARWVEFVSGGQARGREVATVLTAAEAREIGETSMPSAGAVRVDLLKGNDYLRLWINSGGTHYLVHLVVPAGE